MKKKTKFQIAYEGHTLNKTLTREIKIADKERAESDPAFCIAVFDFQKVLTSQQSEVSSFYYRRKFSTYNFTINDIGEKTKLLFYVDGNGCKERVRWNIYSFIQIYQNYERK